MRRLLLAAVAISSVASAQEILSAKAGLLHLLEGKVLINGVEVEQKGDQFLSLKESEVLSTERGRAEVLLNAGTYLRIGENSSFKLTSADLEDTHVTLLSGTALIEVAELPKDTRATIDFLASTIELKKRGLYEFSAEAPGKVRVYDGEIALQTDKAFPIRVAKGRELAFNKLAAGPVKSDEAVTTALYRWGARRARYIAQANAAAASSTSTYMASYGYMGGYSGVWAWNPMFGMYTYLPLRGYGYSPFGGIVLFSPVTYWQRYAAPVMNAGSGISLAQPAAARSAVSSPNYSAPAAVSGGAPAMPAAAAPAAAPAAAAADGHHR